MFALKLLPIIVPVVILLGIVLSGYVKAPTDRAFIISGIRKNPKILIGRAGIKVPFLDRKDVLLIKQISVDIKTNGYIPTQDFIGVDVDAVAKIKLKTDPEGIKIAAQNFLNMNEQKIVEALTDSLQGNMREIIGTITLKELCNDRKQFGDEVQSKAQLDMNALGVEILSCNIQKIEDENGLITDLGQDNMAQIKKNASIAKAEADRDVAKANAEAKREANDAQVKAETEIAIKQNELAIKKAELKKNSDIKQAEADAAYTIQKEEQRKTVEITTADANLAKQEKEISLKEKEVEITRKRLQMEINEKANSEKYAAQMQADATLYQIQKDSEAELFRRQKEAEAEKFEAEQKAEAQKAKAAAERFAKEQEAEAIRAAGMAEADAVSAKGKAEAEAIKAKAEAEAAGILKKAEAMKEYGEAAKKQQELDALKLYFEQLPKIAEAIGKGYANVDSIKMFGGDASQLSGNIMTSLTQVTDGIKESTGIDPNMLLAGFLGSKMAQPKVSIEQIVAKEEEKKAEEK